MIPTNCYIRNVHKSKCQQTTQYVLKIKFFPNEIQKPITFYVASLPVDNKLNNVSK